MDVFKTTVASTVIIRDATVVIEERAYRYSSVLSGKTQQTKRSPPLCSDTLYGAARFQAYFAVLCFCLVFHT